MAFRSSYPLCDKYGLIRTYKMETDFMITADQVESLLEVIETKIAELAQVIDEKSKALERVYSDLGQ